MNDKYILYLYSAAAFHQEVLPAINNSDYAIRLPAEQFNLSQDLRFDLEVLDHNWYLRWKKERYLLKQNKFLRIKAENDDIVSLITRISSELSWSGRKYELSKHQPITIGSGDDSLICYNTFRLISANHAVISFVGKGYNITDKGKNGVYINGKRLTEQKILRFGDCIDLFGLRMVFLEDALAIPGYSGLEEAAARVLLPPYNCHPVNDSTITKKETTFFHRGPGSGVSAMSENSVAMSERSIAIPENDAAMSEIAIEAPAARHEPERQPLLLTMGPAFTFALPMILSVLAGSRSGGLSGSFLYIGLFMAVGSAFLGVFWGIMNWIYQKKSRKWAEKRRRIVYRNYLEEVETYIEQAHRYEAKRLLEKYPVCSKPLAWEDIKKRLWRRNPIQEDFLYQRVGLGDRHFPVKIRVTKQPVAMIRDELKEEPERLRRKYEKLKEVPICIDLRQNGLIGLAGGQNKAGAVQTAISILIQIAVNNCYTEVKLALIYNEGNGSVNELANVAKWLPHIWSEDREMRYLAANRAEAGEVFLALSEVCRSPMKKHYIIFLENQDLLEGEGFSRYVFDKRENLRLTTVFLEEALEDMPNECNYFIRNDCHFTGIIQNGRISRVILDQLSVDMAQELARGLSGIRVKENTTGGEIKSNVPFLSLFSGQRPEDMDIPGQWRKSRIYESIRVPIGRKAGNRLLYLDIHEKYHGPHGLIAGTTGSGKSEVLLTYLLSLAIHFAPEDVTFFIIDYKGGGMGNLLAELPHTVGEVSNLSGNQIRRALSSLKSENERRQRQFQRYGINHINQYTFAYKNGKIGEGIPHLFVIVDEFAELKREEPEFMQELVSVAQIGRSLGIHLILATQKPNGVVDEHIWSNARFRVCLRVQDRQDSMDMLHRPDAAELTGVGRCFLQVGNDEVFELFQAAYGGAEYAEDGEAVKTAGRIITRIGKSAFQPEPTGESTITQAQKVIDYLQGLGKESGYISGNKMWLPPLPAKLSLDKITLSGERFSATVGLCDDPSRQSQYSLSMDLCRQGNVLLCGGPTTGKSTLLQTLIYSLMKSCTSGEAIFYIIDCSSRLLFSFRDMPHTAGLAGEEPDKWERIFYRLRHELRERKDQFAGGSFIHMLRQSGQRLSVGAGNRKEEKYLSATVLVIDNYAGFRKHSKDKYEDIIMQLAAEGSNIGIYLICTVSGISMNEMPDKLASNFGCRLCLSMGDYYQYGEVLRVSRPAVYPEEGIKGRGIVKGEGGVLEFQTALVYGEENDFIRSEKIAKEAMKIRHKSLSAMAEPIPEIPETPDLDFFMKSVSERTEHERRIRDECGGGADEYHSGVVSEREQRVPIGYEQESGNIYDIQLFNMYCFTIIGKKKSGKSNLLKIICRMGKADKTVYIDFTYKTASPIPGSTLCINSEAQLFNWLKELSDHLRQRHHKPGCIFVLIDDLNDFLTRVYHPQDSLTAMGKLVEDMWEKGSGNEVYWFAAWNPEMGSESAIYSGFRIFTGYGSGIHLGGNTSVQRILSFDDLSYVDQNKVLKPGVALIPPTEYSGTKRLILPLIKGEI